ncbi:MAG: hypothetical protein ACLUJR_04315 [Mediterraneibacter gnavus]
MVHNKECERTGAKLISVGKDTDGQERKYYQAVLENASADHVRIE